MKEKIELEINESYIKSMVEKLKNRGVKSQENAKTILHSLGYLERLKKDENVREFCDLEINASDEDLAIFNRAVELLGKKGLPEVRFRVKSELMYIESLMDSLKQCGKRAKNREDREKAKVLYEKLAEIQKELKKRLKQLEHKLKPQELKAETKEFVSKAKEKITSKFNKDSAKKVALPALVSVMLIMTTACGGNQNGEENTLVEPPTIGETAPGWSNMYKNPTSTNNNETTGVETEMDTSAETEKDSETKKPSGAGDKVTAPEESRTEDPTEFITEPTTEKESETVEPGDNDGLFPKGDGSETTPENFETETEPETETDTTAETEEETETKKPGGAVDKETTPAESETNEPETEDEGEDNGLFKI